MTLLGRAKYFIQKDFEFTQINGKSHGYNLHSYNGRDAVDQIYGLLLQIGSLYQKEKCQTWLL